MYCRQCGVQLPTNARFCSKCGTSVESIRSQHPVNSPNIGKKNDPDPVFGLSLIASIVLIWLMAFHHTNIIGMTYIDWLMADCSGSSSSSTGNSDWDDILNDFDQDMSELCIERQGEGFIIICFLFASALFALVLAPRQEKEETDKKNSRKKKRYTVPVLDMHNSIKEFSTDYNERNKIYENIESYVKKMVNLGYEEDAARQYALHFYQQNAYIKNNLDPSLTTNSKEVKLPRPAKPSFPPQNRKEVKRPGPSTPPPNRNNKQD
mgnify:CR=1 FL=1